MKVRLKGLVAAPELNDQIGHLIEFHADRGRWAVAMLIGGAPRLARPKHLEIVEETQSVSDSDLAATAAPAQVDTTHRLAEGDNTHAVRPFIGTPFPVLVLLENPWMLPSNHSQALAKQLVRIVTATQRKLFQDAIATSPQALRRVDLERTLLHALIELEQIDRTSRGEDNYTDVSGDNSADQAGIRFAVETILPLHIEDLPSRGAHCTPPSHADIGSAAFLENDAEEITQRLLAFLDSPCTGVPLTRPT